jgi:tRNA-Thr(GGU) m(6)t(6)A37 methyltransferase TsaA
MHQQPFAVIPIGTIGADRGEFVIRISEAYRPALAELDGFSHLNVLWWCHLLDDPLYREMVVAEKPYTNGPQEVGIFATRSPARPNPIALTVVPVLSIDHDSGEIRAPYIDAEDGSPVLDIKPYLPAVDRIRTTTSPRWCADWPEWYEDSATFDWGSVFENAR